jgi:hypothetical protein
MKKDHSHLRFIMVLGLRNARRARDLTLLAGVERAAPTFIVRIFMHYMS